jgi:hypothetical protein
MSGSSQRAQTIASSYFHAYLAHLSIVEQPSLAGICSGIDRFFGRAQTGAGEAKDVPLASYYSFSTML